MTPKKTIHNALEVANDSDDNPEGELPAVAALKQRQQCLQHRGLVGNRASYYLYPNCPAFLTARFKAIPIAANTYTDQMAWGDGAQLLPSLSKVLFAPISQSSYLGVLT